MKKVRLEQKEQILSAMLWLSLIFMLFPYSADALASVDESQGRSDKDFSGPLVPERAPVGVRRFNLAGKGVAVTTWDDGLTLVCV